ncbi:Putative zinc metalloprotease Rip3 [Aquicella siphonis]|uniref:Zinc metalloprotease n=1 Tax=Aquicella siphonis TaxID=254247 RepID=A0A5E4PGA5_9COXI|nr:site-2 protease family protein [Aquicella siphonis]VVC75548.1 Putative zinc metalloprotease Rip3 [Aquicella siphonis]
MPTNSTHRTGLHLFKLAGFEVKLDWSWLFLAILITWSLSAGYFPSSFPGLAPHTYWIMGIIGALGLFLSIILHELCHSLVGRHYGIPIEGITLFIFGGVAEMREMPPNPKAEFLMAAAGPLFSLVTGILLYYLFQFGAASNWPITMTGILRYLSLINIAVGIFNLLPGFPLDGGRILRSLLWWWKNDLKRATAIACQSGAALGFGMILFGILLLIQGIYISGLWMFLLGFFLQHISKMSYQDLLIREVFSGDPVRKYAKTRLVIVPPDITIQELVDHYFYRYYHKLYPVVENDELEGYISFNEIREIEKSEWTRLKVRQVMRKCGPDRVIDADTEVSKALQIITAQNQGRLIVTEHGKLYGIITLKDLLDIMTIRTGLIDRTKE